MNKLLRSKEKVFGGVCGGVADFFGWNVKLLRLIWVALAIGGCGSPVVFYCLLWFLMPDAARTPMSYEERMKRRLGRI